MRRAKISIDMKRIGEVMSRSEMLVMEGSGWDVDLAALRTDPVASLETAPIDDVDQRCAPERCDEGLLSDADRTSSTT